MKAPIISAACLKNAKERLLKRILLTCGEYYHPGDLFWQELWERRLKDIGLRVLSIERLPYHPVWELKFCGNLAVQAYLLVSKPVPAKVAASSDPISKQLESEIRRIAGELGAPIAKDGLSITRSGAYFRVSFIWPKGRPGRLVKREKPAEAFSLLIRAWLRRTRN